VLEKDRYSPKINIILGDVTEKSGEELQLLHLQRFLIKQQADDILRKIQGKSLSRAFYVVLSEGNDELVRGLLKEHSWMLKVDRLARLVASKASADVCIKTMKDNPEVLKIEDVASNIAMRGDKACTYMVENYPEVLKINDVAKLVAYNASADVCIKMMKDHTEVLKIEGVAFAIAHRNDEASKYMFENYPEVLQIKGVASGAVISKYYISKMVIENYPEVLKMDDVAYALAFFENYKTFVYTIKNHPEVLKIKDVARIVADNNSDRTCMAMIKIYPDVLSMDDVIRYLAIRRRSTVLAYALLVQGKIKLQDMEFTKRQFSNMLDEFVAEDPDSSNAVLKYRAKNALKQIFSEGETYNSRKELDGMSVPYRVLLDMLNVSKGSIERLSKELSESKGDVERVLPIRGLAYALAHKNGGESINAFISKSKSVMDAISLFPTVYELRQMNVIGESEFKQVSNSEDKEVELFKQLVSRVEKTFNVKINSDDAIKAMSDHMFLVDLFGLHSKYHKYVKYSEFPELMLMKVVKHYFEGGIKGFKEFKFYSHELAKEQLSDAYNLREKLMDLDKLTVTYTSKRSIPYDSVKNDIDNFLNHKDKLLMILEEIEKNANNELSEIAKSATKELALLLESKDLDGLTSHAFDPDNEKVKAKGIAQIKLLKARESLDFINNIVDELQKMSGKPKEEQYTHMAAIAKSVAEWAKNKGLEPSKMLRNYISKINELQTNAIKKEELGISANALDNAISIVEVLLKYSKITGETTITAQITFDPSKILTFGRYGSSGAGNCQSSKGNVELNQSLMSMFDPNQFMIMFQKVDDKRPLGFMQVHLLKSKEKGMIFFMENPYTNEPDKSTAMKEAAMMLALKIKEETGIDCFTYGKTGEIGKLTVKVPRSYVYRYIDFLGRRIDPSSSERKISAKCLTSSPLFNLKR